MLHDSALFSHLAEINVVLTTATISLDEECDPSIESFVLHALGPFLDKGIEKIRKDVYVLSSTV